MILYNITISYNVELESSYAAKTKNINLLFISYITHNPVLTLRAKFVKITCRYISRLCRVMIFYCECCVFSYLCSGYVYSVTRKTTKIVRFLIVFIVHSSYIIIYTRSFRLYSVNIISSRGKSRL